MKIIKWLLIILILIPLISYIIWFAQSSTPLNVFIYDKTALYTKVPEHKSFNWILNHFKIVKKTDSSSYIPSEDYFGFFPKDSNKFQTRDLEYYSEKQIDSISNCSDIIYFTDMYGIYFNEWFAQEESLERSELIYGGTTKKDIALLEKGIQKNKLVISEFNLFASPTSRYARKKIELFLNLKWTGWTGRYFEVLDTTKNLEIPLWLKIGYLEQHNNDWPFKKGGIVFVHESDKIEILESDNELVYEIPWLISKPQTIEKYGVIDTIEYPFWFDINVPESKEDVVSYYSIRSNSRGDSLLNKWKIPKEFPAVITGYDSLLYYFCGDFADNKISMNLSYFKGSPSVLSYIDTKKNVMARKSFFYSYYYPLLSSILEPYLN